MSEEKIQKIDLDLSSGLPLEPEFVQEYFVSNILKRVIALLAGWDYDVNQQRFIRVFQDGSIPVRASGIALTHNEAYTGEADSITGAIITFSSPVSVVDIFISGADAVIQRSYDGVVYDDSFIVSSGSMYRFECVTSKMRILSASDLINTAFQIIGWR